MCRWFDSAPGHQEHRSRNANHHWLAFLFVSRTVLVSGPSPAPFCLSSPHHFSPRSSQICLVQFARRVHGKPLLLPYLSMFRSPVRHALTFRAEQNSTVFIVIGRPRSTPPRQAASRPPPISNLPRRGDDRAKLTAPQVLAAHLAPRSAAAGRDEKPGKRSHELVNCKPSFTIAAK